MIQFEQNGVYNLDEVAGSINLSSQWRNGPSKFEFEVLSEKLPFKIQKGSYLTFNFNGENMFAGRVFTTKITEKKTVLITAYDQLRYMKAKDTVMRKNCTLTQFVELCSANLQLRISGLTDTVIPLDDYLFDNQTYLDMVYKSIKGNLLLNTYMYNIYDDFGAICLKDIYDMRLPLVIGDDSLAYQYSYEESIDKDTFNQIKLAYDNKKSGKREIYLVLDSTSIQKYGMLQYFEKVNSGTAGQIIDKANAMIKLKNRETNTLSINALGDPRVRGGSGIKVELAEAGLNCWAIVNKVTHKIDNGIHTMSLDLIIDGGI
ncbi:MAG: hypothetical protein ACK5L6_10220 [Anaerorhabdus sp.]|uniref:XkdQ/YqbQ family protein n=1 Tax=Anaerorhabdus sp. TaxID=1872524 RepID=UPI003A838D75